MIASTIGRAAPADARPGLRFGLLEQALPPLGEVAKAGPARNNSTATWPSWSAPKHCSP
jgi:hypothetical protein